MPSKAKIAFIKKIEELYRIIIIRDSLNAKDDKYHIDILNRSFLFLITGCYEVYIEDIANEVLKFLLKQKSSLDVLVSPLRSALHSSTDGKLPVVDVVNLLKDGWKKKLCEFTRKKIVTFNTPKSENIKKLFKQVLGCDLKMSLKKVDVYVTKRGNIAHGNTVQSLSNKTADDYYELTRKAVNKMDDELFNYCLQKSEKSPWATKEETV